MLGMKRVILILALLLSLSSRADSVTDTHFAEHFVASGVIFTGGYLFMHDGLGMPQSHSFIISAIITLTVGFAYKATEGAINGRMPANTGQAMLFNAAGVAAPGLVLTTFDF
jgi:hypothetical protein